MHRYFPEPYRFVPPYESTFWAHFAGWISPWYLRARMAVRRLELRGLNNLRAALGAGAGVLLAPNHCRWADGVVLGQAGLAIGSYFLYVVSAHMFRGGRAFAWWFNRLGCFSMNREGVDRASLRACARLLAGSTRPLVVFPEGTWFHQNDRLCPLQEGIALIARQAARQTRRPLLVLPVALKYWLLDDARPAVARWLTASEARLGWEPQEHLDLTERLDKLAGALLALKEIEYMGKAREGGTDERRLSLTQTLLRGLEASYWGRAEGGPPLERIRRLRQLLVPRLPELAAYAAKTAEVRRHLTTLLFCEGLLSHDHAYLLARPSHERLAEAAERLEEMVHDAPEKPLVPLGAVVEVGAPLPLRDLLGDGPRRDGPSLLVETLAGRIQGLLDGLVLAGPPPAWGCPAPLEAGTVCRSPHEMVSESTLP